MGDINFGLINCYNECHCYEQWVLTGLSSITLILLMRASTFIYAKNHKNKIKKVNSFDKNLFTFALLQTIILFISNLVSMVPILVYLLRCLNLMEILSIWYILARIFYDKHKYENLKRFLSFGLMWALGLLVYYGYRHRKYLTHINNQLRVSLAPHLYTVSAFLLSIVIGFIGKEIIDMINIRLDELEDDIENLSDDEKMVIRKRILIIRERKIQTLILILSTVISSIIQLVLEYTQLDNKFEDVCEHISKIYQILITIILVFIKVSCTLLQPYGIYYVYYRMNQSV